MTQAPLVTATVLVHLPVFSSPLGTIAPVYAALTLRENEYIISQTCQFFTLPTTTVRATFESSPVIPSSHVYQCQTENRR